MNVPVAAGPVATGAAGAGPGDVPCPELPDGGDVCASASDRSASVDSAVDDIIKPRKTRLCMIRLLDFLDIVPARSALCDKCQTIIPAARTLDSSVDCRAAGISLISRAAATPTLRAYQSALRAAGITLNLLNANFILVGCQKQKR